LEFVSVTIGADLFLIATGVERVATNFNRPDQKWLDRITVGDAKRLYDADQFDRGSMGPKIQAVVGYLK